MTLDIASVTLQLTLNDNEMKRNFIGEVLCTLTSNFTTMTYNLTKVTLRLRDK